MEAIPWRQKVERPAFAAWTPFDPASRIVDRDVALANDLEAIALDNERRVLIDADAQQFGLGLDDF